MSKFLDELRKLPRFTSPKGMLFPANDGELVEVGSVISLFRSVESDLNDEFESLKAITELALKEIKSELSFAIMFDHKAAIVRLQESISEIERLQNE